MYSLSVFPIYLHTQFKLKSGSHLPKKVIFQLFIQLFKYFNLIVIFLTYLNFCPDFFSHVGKQLDKKPKVYCTIYDVTNWETNDWSTYIGQSQEVKAKRQRNLVTLTLETFLLKSHAENKAGRLVPDLFLFFKKSLYETKVSDQHLSFNIFWQPSTWTYNRNKLCKTWNG